MADLGYFAADTLGMTLYQVDGKLKAEEIRQLRLGPWQMDLHVKAESDIIDGRHLTFWLTMAKKLRLYLVIREKECWMAVLDEAKLKDVGKKTGFAAETVKERLKELRPAMKALFQWADNSWNKISLKDGRQES